MVPFIDLARRFTDKEVRLEDLYLQRDVLVRQTRTRGVGMKVDSSIRGKKHRVHSCIRGKGHRANFLFRLAGPLEHKGQGTSGSFM